MLTALQTERARDDTTHAQEEKRAFKNHILPQWQAHVYSTVGQLPGANGTELVCTRYSPDINPPGNGLGTCQTTLSIYGSAGLSPLSWVPLQPVGTTRVQMFCFITPSLCTAQSQGCPNASFPSNSPTSHYSPLGIPFPLPKFFSTTILILALTNTPPFPPF